MTTTPDKGCEMTEINGWAFESDELGVAQVACDECIAGIGDVRAEPDGTHTVRLEGDDERLLVTPVTELEPGTRCLICRNGGETTEWNGSQWLSTLDGHTFDD